MNITCTSFASKHGVRQGEFVMELQGVSIAEQPNGEKELRELLAGMDIQTICEYLNDMGFTVTNKQAAA
ncbi:hypothetical protein DVH07_06325 [Hafnia paralvei]|uniref:hypothetical protein n=1 Tax=Hafnia paralvei TaxID=546367 RepID=UPI000DF36712|nr:hypothetical protein [Hafnia paralvei]RDA68312.1 hypothetical protein DU449_07635 [Hafnia paralvei]RDA69351.1 hypothetical protein DVH09_08230 [Hafnia paralvei]RDA69512.1 hypothetical protein DVH08_09225 [Hafnia paralvei]RDA79555.1 hypothetical protein DVH10_06615 [Hafnia paralvei]RDA80092.1 hypothetical protein DVH07_06325 [Hafnia paralvei]